MFFVLQNCTVCNCTKYLLDKFGNETVTPQPSTTMVTTAVTTTAVYEIIDINNIGNQPTTQPNTTDPINQPVDTSVLPARPSCGIQIVAGLWFEMPYSFLFIHHFLKETEILAVMFRQCSHHDNYYLSENIETLRTRTKKYLFVLLVMETGENQQLVSPYMEFTNTVYSLTYIKRSSLWQRKGGSIRQVTS